MSTTPYSQVKEVISWALVSAFNFFYGLGLILKLDKQLNHFLDYKNTFNYYEIFPNLTF
jgi:hypothetical protein